MISNNYNIDSSQGLTEEKKERSVWVTEWENTFLSPPLQSEEYDRLADQHWAREGDTQHPEWEDQTPHRVTPATSQESGRWYVTPQSANSQKVNMVSECFFPFQEFNVFNFLWHLMYFKPVISRLDKNAKYKICIETSMQLNVLKRNKIND